MIERHEGEPCRSIFIYDPSLRALPNSTSAVRLSWEEIFSPDVVLKKNIYRMNRIYRGFTGFFTFFYPVHLIILYNNYEFIFSFFCASFQMKTSAS